MKSSSASIVITAGLAAVVHGAMFRSDTGTVAMGVGILTMLVGFVGWFKSLSQP